MFVKEMKETTKGLEKSIQLMVTEFDDNPKKAIERKKKAVENLQYFAKTYFPHYINQPDSKLHVWLYKNLPEKITGNGARIAIAAPRGEAKSTIVTLIFVIWMVAKAEKKMIPVIMDVLHQAEIMLAAIKIELEYNNRIAKDFPEIAGSGSIWKDVVIITKNNVKIQAIGTGQRIRGLRHGQHRPDLVILDDVENDKNVLSLKLRDQLTRWINTAVLNLSEAGDTMDVIMIGTIMHHDSTLARIINNPGWETIKFKAVINWPDKMALWDKWESIYKTQGKEIAKMFYQSHKKGMDQGVILSWPEVRTLIKLMEKRILGGKDAFDAELQNDPIPTNATFTQIKYWKGEPDSEWLYYAAIDPSLGKKGHKGDPSAIIIGGYDKSTGILRIVVADIQKRTPNEIIKTVIQYQKQYQCRLWTIETVQFQEFFKDEIIRRSAQAGTPVPAKGIKPVTDKRLRIEVLQPHCVNGLIQFREEHVELIQQFKHFGDTNVHDDGPDAVEMLWSSLHFNTHLNEGAKGTGARMSMSHTHEMYTEIGFGTVQNIQDLNGYIQ